MNQLVCENGHANDPSAKFCINCGLALVQAPSASITTQQQPPAGWYDDPSDPSMFRYWDGARWLNQTQPKQSAPPTQAPAAAVAVGALQADAPKSKTPKPKKAAAPKPKRGAVAAESAPTNSRSALTVLVAMGFIAVITLLGGGFLLYQYSEGNIFNGTPSAAAEQAQENTPAQTADATDETAIEGDTSAGNQGNKQTNKKKQATNKQASNTDDEKPKEQEPSTSAQCADFYNKDNFQRAFEPCLAAAKAGDSAAYFRVAYIYDTEKGDFDNAKIWYKKSAEAGNTKAMYNLGYINHVEYEDYPNAIKWYREAANRGDVDAMNNLGTIYFDIEENFDEGCRWYKKASDKGNKSGRNNYNDFCT